ncbi:MAG: glutathione S-transferase family protein [Leptolyngbyaceae bacterium]|nr:glutathione S-transferase family protein [Leptolyngbyaceae bacterium]
MARTLYYTPRSPYARKVRIVMAEKNLSCTLIDTDVKQKSPEFLRLNPIGKIPVFIDENGLIFWDSTLIVEYLEETYPDSPFYPTNPLERLRCKQGEELADSLTDAIVALSYEVRKGTDANAQVQAHHQQNVDRMMSVFEQQLSQAQYLLTNNLTIVDVAVISGLGYYTLRCGDEWSRHFPAIAEWGDRLHQLPSIQSTIP